MLGDFEQKLVMTTSGAVQLCSFGGGSPPQVTSISPPRASGLSSVHSTLLERGALQLLCHYGKFLNTGAPFFALVPEIVVVPVLGASSHGSQGV